MLILGSWLSALQKNCLDHDLMEPEFRLQPYFLATPECFSELHERCPHCVDLRVNDCLCLIGGCDYALRYLKSETYLNGKLFGLIVCFC